MTNLIPCKPLLVLLLLAGGNACAWGDQELPDCYVLSVGIDAYSAQVGRLRGCVNDARTAESLFRKQEAKMFGKVHGRLLTDNAANRFEIEREMQGLMSKGKAADYVVLFLSGHGESAAGRWHFLPCNFWPGRHDNTISDDKILGFADGLAANGKKVVVIIDACFAGLVRVRAQPYLAKHQDAARGGIVLLLSSKPTQTSAALGNYSAFAQAVAEGLSGRADANRDHKVSVGEVGSFARQRVPELLRQRRLNHRQDCEYACSPSLSEEFVLAVAAPQIAANEPAPPEPAEHPASSVADTVWMGSESLAGFGKLRFELRADGNAAMTDAKRRVLGAWSQRGDEVAIRFGNCTYAGKLSGDNLAGNAAFTNNNGREWSFSVARQSNNVDQPAAADIANTSWTGRETLAGFGTLRFDFQAGGAVMMTDAENRVRGSWMQNGATVTIRFDNCAYTGRISGADMSGAASFSNHARSWTFQVTRNQ